MAASKVWFWNLRASRKAPFDLRMRRLLKSAGAMSHVRSNDLAAIKIHFGEAGVSEYIRPLWLKPIIDLLRKAGAKPFLTDANTLYAGDRGEAVSHLMRAAAHGFDPLLLGAPVIIADGLRSGNETEVDFPGRYFESAFVASDIVEADQLFVVSHFKGHELAGYGGALKNAAMGSATRRGKMQQHKSLGPELRPDHCQGCGACVEVCGSEALRLSDDSVILIEKDRCTGCGACFHACRHGGINVDWRIDLNEFLTRMMDYAGAVLLTRPRPAFFVNFVVSVTPDCDCIGFSDAPVCPDLGVAASFDPVALDQACLDLVDQAPVLGKGRLPEGLEPGASKFLALHPELPEDMGLAHAEKIGLGSRAYELVSL